MSYDPLPGTTAFRALEIIRREGAIARGPLADQLGINLDSLADHLHDLTRASLVHKVKDRGMLRYCTTEYLRGAPAKATDPNARPGEWLVPNVEAVTTEPLEPAAADMLAHLETPTPPPIPVRAQRLKRLYQSVDCDGTYTVRDGGRIYTFDPEQAKEIALFIIAAHGVWGIE